MALATLLTVPSPPHATTVVAPSPIARRVSSFSSCSVTVVRMSVTPTAANADLISGNRFAPRPLPEAGLTITVTLLGIANRQEPTPPLLSPRYRFAYAASCCNGWKV